MEFLKQALRGFLGVTDESARELIRLRADVDLLTRQQSWLENELNILKQGMKKMTETQTDLDNEIASVGAEVSNDFAALNTKLDADVKAIIAKAQAAAPAIDFTSEIANLENTRLAIKNAASAVAAVDAEAVAAEAPVNTEAPAESAPEAPAA